jgi:hypothetical protein
MFVYPRALRNGLCLLFGGIVALYLWGPTAQAQGPAKVYKRGQFSSPIPGLNLPYEEFTLDAVSGGTVYTNQSNTLLCLPPDALVDEYGRKVTGNIKLLWREMFEPAQLALTGIPMQVETPNGPRQLETGGMFEVLAEQNGKPVFLAPGKILFIQSTELGFEYGRTYDFYVYDVNLPGWVRQQNYNTSSTPIAGSVGNTGYNERFESPSVVEPFTADNGNVEPMGENVDGEEVTNLRKLGLSQFGLNNYDVMLKEDSTNQVVFAADFTLNGQRPKKEGQIMVVYQGLNTVYYYYGEAASSKFRLFLDREPVIFMPLEGGNVARVDPATLPNLRTLQGKKVTLDLKTAARKIASPGDLRQFILNG